MPRHTHIHIAILDTDVPVPTVYAARGLYSSQFRVLLQSAAERLNQSSSSSSSSSSSPPPSSRHIKIHTSAYDVVGGSFPALGMLRRMRSRKHEDKDNYEEQEDAFRPIDAILITGSGASAYYKGEKYKWIASLQTFIRQVWTHYPAVKMFGSCFGHQVIAQALFADDDNHDNGSNDTTKKSVRVEACPLGYEVGIHPITLDPAFAANTALGRTFSRGLKGHDGKLRIQLVHGDRVIGSDLSTAATAAAEATTDTLASLLNDLPTPWLNIGSTPTSPIQGLYYTNRILTYQGHFEFDGFVNTETVLEFGRRGGWDAQVVAQYLQQICSSGSDDSELAAEVVVQFLAGDDYSNNSNDKHSRVDVQDIKMEEYPAIRSVVENGLATPPEEIHMSI